jgi:benzil reductase ((S)-benzoin forming)
VSRIVWVSGASSGIGAGLARTAPAGARIIGIARRPSASGESIIADLSDPASWDRVCREIEDVLADARPDEAALLHFAGVATPMGPAVSADPAEYRAAVLLNSASGQVLGASFLAACERHGVSATVVMCSSPGAVKPQAGMTHYAAGKAALEHWSRALALEQRSAGRPARVFSVVPHAVDTPMVRAAMEEPADALPIGQFFREAASGGRLADPVTTAREIWALVDGDVEPGSAARVGAVPEGV